VVIAGIVIAVGGMLGFNYYKHSKLEAQLAGSELFESLAQQVGDGNLDAAEAVASDIVTSYPTTAYAAQSRLAMARLYMDKNRDQDAVDMLKELLAMRGNDELKSVARLRLARVLLYQDKPQEVVDLLAEVDDAAFAGLNAEVLGDAYAALGDTANAAAAYRRALADPSPNSVVDRALVQMKLVDLPEAMATAAAEVTPDTEDGESE
jgi:predicted negative regulator of RcsB-dependent stress response